MKLRRTAPVVAVTGALLCAAPATAAAIGPKAPDPGTASTITVVSVQQAPADSVPTGPGTEDSGTEWIIGAGALTLAVGAGMVAVGRHRSGSRG
jgi:hypothetical protein